MRRCIKILFLFCWFVFLFPALTSAAANHVTMQIDSPYANVDGRSYELQVAPCIRDDVTLVPLRFITEAFGAEVVWNAGDKEITLRQGERVIRFWAEKNEAIVDGEMQAMSGVPVVENDVTLVPVRFLVENLDYEVNFQPLTKNIIIKQLPPPNQPPVAG